VVVVLAEGGEQAMKAWGLVLAAIGTIIAIGALFMSTSAPIDVPSTSLYGVPSTSEVYNLGLLRNQLFVFLAGCTLFVAGVVMACVGHVLTPRPTVPAVTMAPLQPEAERTRELSPVAEPARASEEELAAADAADRITYMVIGAAVLLILIVGAFVATAGSRAPGAPAATEMNAEAMVANMETQADNMDAIADNTSASSKPARSSGTEAAPYQAGAEADATEPEAAPEADGDAEVGRDNWAGE
jgi:hypothetical protein